jgi:hypothetical protein
VSRRTKPKDPFRDARRRAVNEELRERIHKRFVTMYSMLLPQGKSAEAAITSARAREVAADYAVANREDRRRHFGERGDGRLAPGAARMEVPGKRKTRS